MKSNKIVLGVAAGLATGLLLGVLFAPHKGSRTRRRIVRASGQMGDDLKEKIDAAMDKVQEKYDAAIKNAEVKLRTIVAGKPDNDK